MIINNNYLMFNGNLPDSSTKQKLINKKIFYYVLGIISKVVITRRSQLSSNGVASEVKPEGVEQETIPYSFIDMKKKCLKGKITNKSFYKHIQETNFNVFNLNGGICPIITSIDNQEFTNNKHSFSILRIGNHTNIEIDKIFKFRSINSILMYELLVTKKFLYIKNFKLKSLKILLDLESMENYKFIKIIEKCLSEINKIFNSRIKYSTVKKDKKIYSVVFNYNKI